jgi:NTP pyrophosphatase (non-canonical NTP hydrolase)
MAEMAKAPIDGLDAVQHIQKEYDVGGWRIAGTSHEKARHITLHLVKTVGELAAVVERNDHRFEEGQGVTNAEVAKDLIAIEGRIADLVSYAAQLANLAGSSLGSAWVNRIESNAKRWAPDSPLANLASRETS